MISTIFGGARRSASAWTRSTGPMQDGTAPGTITASTTTIGSGTGGHIILTILHWDTVTAGTPACMTLGSTIRGISTLGIMEDGTAGTTRGTIHTIIQVADTA